MEQCNGCFYDANIYIRCTKCNRVVADKGDLKDLFIDKEIFREQIKKALNYIDENNNLIEIKEVAKWKKNGILSGLNDIKSEFCFDKELKFIDGTIVIVWIENQNHQLI